jgi:AAA15 family ATPase/GTPase
MAVFLSGYGNKNYRSFGEEGILLEGLTDINVIIGENNGGKTNVLRTLEIWESSRKRSPIRILATDYYENDNSNKIEYEFVIPAEMAGNLDILLTDNNPRPFIKLTLNGENYSVTDSFIRRADSEAIRAYCNSNFNSSSSENSQNVQSIENQQQFGQLLNQIPQIHYLKERRVQATPKNFRDRLAPIWSHGAANRVMVPIKKALRDFIEEGFESKIEIQFEQDSESFTIEMNDELVTFESLGSGFQQVFDVALTIASVRNSIVLIDEPELNTHPNLLRRLLKLIFANNSNQYFICTHSNVLLDATYPKTIYKMSGGKYSTVEKCETLELTRGLLNDLGVKASDILQTNGIIWVEGPSDRTYINHWLQLQGTEAKEGLDYTFQYYGGKLLAHYKVNDDISDFVNILDISRNAFIVMDSDWKDSARKWKNEDLAERKRRIIEACNAKSIPFWVTSGREIENYISNESWTAFEGKEISLSANESVSEKSQKYKIKAKAAHDVVSFIDEDDYRTAEELVSHISKLNDLINEWNTQ